MTLTPELFDTLIVACIVIGLALAVVRLYADFTRPLPRHDEPVIYPPESERGER